MSCSKEGLNSILEMLSTRSYSKKGHVGGIRASAVLGKAIALLPAAEMLQEAISSPEDGLGLSRLDH